MDHLLVCAALNLLDCLVRLLNSSCAVVCIHCVLSMQAIMCNIWSHHPWHPLLCWPNLLCCSQVSTFPLSVMFGLCVVLLILCVGCQLRLNALIRLDDSAKITKPHADGLRLRTSTAGVEKKAVLKGRVGLSH